jgi:hypothetical protein
MNLNLPFNPHMYIENHELEAVNQGTRAANLVFTRESYYTHSFDPLFRLQIF